MEIKSEQQIGTVKLYKPNLGYGFIIDNDGNDIYFKIANVRGKKILSKGDVVKFLVSKTNDNNKFPYYATDVHDLYSEGIVIFYQEDKEMGFLKGKDGIDRRFYLNKVRNKIVLKKGQKVKFIPYVNSKNMEMASDIFLMKLSDIPSIKDNTLLLKEIKDNWRAEAKLEDAMKYFYHLEEVSQISNGNKSFVIGRKGTGKTAISEYLFNQKTFDCYTDKLDFQYFKFNELYSKKDFNFPLLHNQYITIWKLLIYSSILKMMSLNEKLDSKLLKLLREMFPIDTTDSLTDLLGKINDDFEVTLFETIKLKKETKILNKREYSWIEKSDIYENIISQYVDSSKYIIIMDALDDDYNDPYNYNQSEIERKSNYFRLVTSLFKAIQYIKGKFSTPNFSIIPVVFLRDDIYRQLQDDERHKWRDLTVNLIWNKYKIQNMLAYRISKSMNISAEELSFDDAWSKLFPNKYIETQRGAQRDIFDYIADRTFLRPRDFVNFIKICCEFTISNGHKQINSTDIGNAKNSLSKEINGEIQAEMKGTMFDIREIMDIIQRIGKSIFTANEFIERYNKLIQNKKLKQNIEGEKVLEYLYQFNIIGNIKDRTEIFYLFNQQYRLNLEQNLVLHKAFRSSLLIN